MLERETIRNPSQLGFVMYNSQGRYVSVMCTIRDIGGISNTNID